MDKVRLTTTLNLLRKYNACNDRYAVLVNALGGEKKYGLDTPINLLTILEHNGIYDCIWAFRATVEDCDRVARLLACEFAEHVLPVYEAKYPGDDRPRVLIDTSRRYANGEATREELNAAANSAYAAVNSAAHSVAYAAYAVYSAAYAVYSAAHSVAYFAYAVYSASYAVYAAGAYAAEREWQAGRIREYLKD